MKFASRIKPTGRIWSVNVEGVCFCPICGTKLIEIPFSQTHKDLGTCSLNCPKCERKWILELVEIREGSGGVLVHRRRSKVYRTEKEWKRLGFQH